MYKRVCVFACEVMVLIIQASFYYVKYFELQFTVLKEL